MGPGHGIQEGAARRAELLVVGDYRATVFTSLRSHIPPSGLLCHGMLTLAVRTYEPWTLANILGALFLLALIVGVLIFALQRTNR